MSTYAAIVVYFAVAVVVVGLLIANIPYAAYAWLS